MEMENSTLFCRMSDSRFDIPFSKVYTESYLIVFLGKGMYYEFQFATNGAQRHEGQKKGYPGADGCDCHELFVFDGRYTTAVLPDGVSGPAAPQLVRILAVFLSGGQQ